MQTYLLLRDNKQSGPFSFDELTAKGLKAYDLIWIEGKSAAWRYPSEIQELKPFAPVVEEQPYDRFYKKQNTAEKKPEESQNIPQIENRPVSRNYVSKSNSKIVVILPANQRNERSERAERTERTEVRERAVLGEADSQRVERTEVKKTFTETSSLPERKAVQPLYDIKEHAVDKLLIPSKEKNDKKSSRKMLKVSAGVLVLLGAGLVIAWAFNRPFAVQEEKLPPSALSTRNVVDTKDPELNNRQIITGQSIPDYSVQQKDSASLASAASSLKTALLPKKPVSDKTKPLPTDQEATMPAKEETETKAPEPVSNASDNEDAEKKSAKKNIAELVKITKNDYKVGAFGGLNNVQVQVSNSSSYPIDLVVVEVKYILANKKEFKAENLYFKNIAPGTTISKEAPKSPRGIKVESRIALITSKSLGMYQSGL